MRTGICCDKYIPKTFENIYSTKNTAKETTTVFILADGEAS